VTQTHNADERTTRSQGGAVREPEWTTASLGDLHRALRTGLLLDSSPVGVRIFRSAEEFEACTFSQPRVPVHYCSAVRMASEGSSLKLSLEDMSCDTAPRTLGLQPGFMDADFVDSYVAAGLYQDRQQAEEILADVTVLSDVVGVALSPLDTFENLSPDVVIVSTLPYGAMRLTQAVTFSGSRVRSNNIGMHGVCSECTAAPASTGQVCTSLLCSGTRHIAGWDDRLVSVGIPMELLPQVVGALMSTAEKCETDERKGEMRVSCSCTARPSDRTTEAVSGLSDRAGYFYEE